MSYLKTYRKRTSVTGRNSKEKMIAGARHKFEDYLASSPSSHTVLVSKTDNPFIEYNHKMDCIIIDLNDNDSASFDEKRLLVRHNEDISLGCYVKWNSKEWLITGEDIKSYSGHRKFSMKLCNASINHRVGNDIRVIPINVSNLTLYSDGLATQTYTEFGDAKRNIYVGKNGITSTLKEGTRIMLNKTSVFRITHIDNFTVDNVYNYIALQEQIRIEDDVENNIAWNKELSLEESDTPTDNKPSIDEDFSPLEIIGEEFIYMGASAKYTVRDNNYSWYLESKGEITIKELGNTEIILEAKRGNKYVGKTAYLSLMNGSEVVTTKKITIKGFS